MSATVLQFPGVADDDTDDLFAELDPAEPRTFTMLDSVAARLLLEALDNGESHHKLHGGCHVRLGVQGDRRRLIVWRVGTDPSGVELVVLHRTFNIPAGTWHRWAMSGAQKVAVFRWSINPIGDVYEDRETIADIRAMVERGEYRQALDNLNRIHGNAEQIQVLDLIQAAKAAAKEVTHAQ